MAFLNTDLAASFAATTWLFLEWGHARKPHFVGLLTGAVAGLATITPAAGFVPIYASVIIGIVSAFVCYYAVQLKNRLRWDDALDVWGVHGVGGMLGIILLGVFASTAINPAGGVGLIHGSASFFVKQVVAAFACSAVRIRVHVCDAEGDRPHHDGARGGGGGAGARRGHARRERVRGRAALGRQRRAGPVM